jgi:hypothetical protein
MGYDIHYYAETAERDENGKKFFKAIPASRPTCRTRFSASTT